MDESIQICIILVFLPENTTFLIQPLYIVVLKPFDTISRYFEFLENWYTIFKSSVIWYTSFPEIQSIWILYNYGGASPKLIDIQHWITYQEVVQTKTLQLTPPIY